MIPGFDCVEMALLSWEGRGVYFFFGQIRSYIVLPSKLLEESVFPSVVKRRGELERWGYGR